MRAWVLGLSLLLTLPGCAWQNPDNRLLWNAFEKNWVPEDDPAFSLTLPLTVPAGLLAILLDVVVVHPVSIIDDAWEQALSPWERIDWQDEYWYESATVPFRVVGTGIAFAFGLLGRALFDLPPFEADEVERKAGQEIPFERADMVRALAQVHADWLRALLGGEVRDGPYRLSMGVTFADLPWRGELAELASRVRVEAAPRARIAFYRWAHRSRPPGLQDQWVGLSDPDARVRAVLLATLGALDSMPAQLAEALRADPDPVVAELAWQLLPRR